MHVHAEGAQGILRAHVRQARPTLGDVRVCPAWHGRERRGPERSQGQKSS